MNDYPKQFHYHIDEFKKMENIALFVPKILDGVRNLWKRYL